MATAPNTPTLATRQTSPISPKFRTDVSCVRILRGKVVKVRQNSVLPQPPRRVRQRGRLIFLSPDQVFVASRRRSRRGEGPRRAGPYPCGRPVRLPSPCTHPKRVATARRRPPEPAWHSKALARSLTVRASVRRAGRPSRPGISPGRHRGRPRGRSLPRIFLHQYPAGCGVRGKSAYGLLGLADLPAGAGWVE